MLVLSLRPGLEDIVLKTSDGEIRLCVFRDRHGLKLGMIRPEAVQIRREDCDRPKPALQSR